MPEGLIAKARLRSIAGQVASAWLETLPTARCPVLPDGYFRPAMSRRLGLPNLPQGAPSVTCFCGAPLACTDSEHAHTCPTPNALRVLCHDSVVEIVRRALRRGGEASSKETLLAVHRAVQASEAARQVHVACMNHPPHREGKPADQTVPLLLPLAPNLPHIPIADFLPSLNTTRRAMIKGKWRTAMGRRSHQGRPHQREAPPAEEPPAEEPPVEEPPTEEPPAEPAGRSEARGDILFELNGSLHHRRSHQRRNHQRSP
jgi:hypothetical protein